MVRILCCDLGKIGPEGMETLLDQASPERKQRAMRCLRREYALEILAGEALLRLALPGGVPELCRTSGGKPVFRDREGLWFNLSHSSPYAALALGDSPVGIDVEGPKPNRDLPRLMGRCFCAEEQAYAAPQGQVLPDRFYQVWTAKESWLKYLGTGITGDMREWNVFAPGLPDFRRYPLPGGFWLTVCTRERVGEPEWVTL